MKSYGWSTLSVAFHSEREQDGVNMKICHATVGTPEMHVFDAFVITGGGMMNCVNVQSLASLEEAVAFHIGKLVTDGAYRIVAKV